MSILFVDQPEHRTRLLPLTYTRPVADLRVGILTITEKWSRSLDLPAYGFLTEAYLTGKFGMTEPTAETLWIFNGLLPDEQLVTAVQQLHAGDALWKDDQLLAARGQAGSAAFPDARKVSYVEDISMITRAWDIFALNGQEIRRDYQLLTRRRNSAEIRDPYTRTYGEDIFLEEGASVRAAILNAENGPIYLGKNSEVHEGAMIRGPFALGAHSVVSMGAKIRGDSSTGPYCKIGGEISNSLLWGYSNKGHDGFLGNSVIGEWCNLGANTNNSNLKNSYDPVRMWDYETESFIHTGRQFCGLIMADHSKSAISTMFNTGTTVGVAANIFGEGFPRTIIPSFSWGGASGFVTHQPRKALITADAVMQRRNLSLPDSDKVILNHIFEASSRFRVWEKE